ncbi:MAG: PEPxxWA-CTERM sorting domain-containing protein [Proteobacteria bacterium]|nr:PEPxxWA-CTERM sorting domain-containing protein [Pseudomonadota bacterium]
MNKDSAKRLAAAAIAAAALACAGESQASQTLYLDVDGCSGGCGLDLYGEATVNSGNAGYTEIDIHLADGVTFATDGTLNAAAFDVIGSPTLTDTVLTSHFAAQSPHTVQTISEPPFGNFGYDVVWTGGGPASQDLQFRIAAGGAVSLGSTTYNGIPLLLSVGVQHTVNGVLKEGYIGGTTNLLTPSAPEPSTWALLIMGFGLTGAALRRRRQPQLGV